ncbi:peptidoglycan/LPS O-acetylase OafA/YrhL [Humibacillus xanthopallidus]|uniref:Peptidoglycan/LPS O-acetylase OafA/YrhL n=1 Tax=Humibacillus xanthopallidus TaxID=412689 RepID=A0A543PSW5_9MICO|nr:acyltransferase family protein [Humibacillus xanthopallidus]TQN47146.1 peptidoglycan/LPS O-acetylase OafA/YrhL [Humibacillus xanthopallidus]
MTTSARPLRQERTAPAEVATGSIPAGGRHPRDRIEGLDGLRALAIVGVLVYHLDAAWLPGGFLGVDVFFVVSGFLITTLLVHEHRRTGRIALSQFWVRRARRLLPALVLCVVTSVLIARVVSADLLVDVGRQMAGALTFSTNWLEITAGSSYFDQTAPQLFMNFWSLAVEEQFYLLWPLITIGLLALSSRVRVGAAVAIGGGSALLMALLYVPDADATRVYYGTDTHLIGLMAGAALAFAWASPRLARFVTPSHWGRFGWVAGPLAGIVLLAEMVLLDEQQALTFRGGIALASLATALLIMGVIDPAPSAAGGPTAVQRLARHPVATWVGARSYSIYLWHWPVILLVALDNPSAPGTISHLLTRLWCVVVTLALADLTYRFVEGPFRTLGFRGVGARLRDQTAALSVPTRRGLAAFVTVVAVVVTGIVVTAPAQSETARMLAANEAAAEADEPSPAPSGAAATGSPSGQPTAAPSALPTGLNSTFTMPAGKDIDAYGDSIMVGSLQAMRYYFPGIRIDAKSNRRWSDAVTQVTARGDANRRAVVLAFGTNAGVDEAGVAKVLDELGPNRMIVLVNVMGPFSRIEKDNAKLEAIAKGRSNVAIADWASAVRAHPEQVQSDRIHPTIKGAHLFSKAVRQALAEISERNTGTPVVLKELPIP